VHMLSKNAFNALLKTLEEPPPSVIFIFATTEIRKVPVTVLSRCMRFDLRRVPASLLVDHFGGIAEKENVAIEPEALALIARAADGSVRDGLSLMDQAIALGDGKNVSAAEVRDMLGLADRQLTFDLMEAVIEGQPTQALEIYANLHKAGAEALTVIQDLLELTHFITRCALAPEAGRSADVPEAEATRATALAGKLAMPALTRIWQILMNGLQEVQRAPQPYMAAEMILLRLCHASGLPDPADLVRQLTENGGAAALAASPAGAGSSGGPAASANQNLRAYGNGNSPASGTSMALPSRSASSAIAAARQVQASPAAAMQPAAATAPQTEVALVPPPVDFDAVIALLGQKAEKLLEGELRLDAKVVTYEIGRIQLEDGTRVTSGQGLRLSRLLTEWTGQPWIVELVRGQGQATLKDRQSEAIRLEREEASRHPVIARIKEAFPGTEILEIRDLSKGGEASTDDPGATGAIGGEQEPAFDPEDPGFSGDEYEVDF
jgi:DNA polymerase III subunit gamma/tau